MAPQSAAAVADLEMEVAAPEPAPESAFQRYRRFRKKVRKTRYPMARRMHAYMIAGVVVAVACYAGWAGEAPAMTVPDRVSSRHGRLLSSDMSCKKPLAVSEYATCAGTAANCTTGKENPLATDCPAGCTYTPPVMMGGGMGALYLLGCLYIFIGIGIVCDFFFEPSLEAISEALDLSPDVAGATFMAAGSSAPELFTSVGDTFGTGNNIGIGTIVGSAMFNILIIIAVSAMYAGQELDIEWMPVARDVAFYSASVGLLVIFFLSDDWIEWWEGMVMVLGYGSYILFMFFNSSIQAKCQKATPKVEEVKKKKLERSMTRSLKKNNKEEGENKKGKFSRQSSRAMVMVKQQDKANSSKVHPESGEKGGGGGDDDDDEAESLWEWPDSIPGQIMFILSVPFNLAFTITVPNCADKRFEKLYPVTFVMCIVWLAVLCFFMAMLGTAIGCIFDIDPLVMGILLLAIGTSVPDAMASMIVAKAGEGGMAIANAIGSNVFDILLGLGLPWMIYGLVECPAAKKVNPNTGVAGTECVIFRDTSGNLYLDLGILYATVGLFVTAMVVNKWKMNNTLAWMLIILYVVYITFQIVMAKFVKD